MKRLLLAAALLAASAVLSHAQAPAAGSIAVQVKNVGDGSTTVWLGPGSPPVVQGIAAGGTPSLFGLGSSITVNEGALVVAPAWSSITGTPTTLAGYGITDGLTAATAASTYVSLTGSYADPAWIAALAWSKITGKPTTLSGYGITDTEWIGTVRGANSGGYLELASNSGYGAPSGDIVTSSGSDGSSGDAGFTGGVGGTIWTYGGTAAGGGGEFGDMAAGGGGGGGIQAYGGDAFTSSGGAWAGGTAGSILTYGGNASEGTAGLSGGSITTHTGGGSINTRGTGSIQLGSTGTRTTIVGAAASNWTLTLPTGPGTNGQVLTTNGSGTTSWTTAGGTVTSVAVAGTDGLEVDSGSPITSAGTITLGVNASTLKTHLALGNVENTALSTWAGSANLTTLGTITSGTWQGTNIDWIRVSKTGSSLADLATRSAGDLTSGTLDAARLPAPTTTTLGGVKRNAGTGGQFVNGIDTDGSLTYGTPAGGGSALNHVILSSDVTITNPNALVNITGLSFSAAANTSYEFRVYAVVVTSAAGAGYEFGLTGPASPTFWATEARAFNATAGANSPGILNSVSGAYGTIALNANGSVVGTQVVASGVFQNGANAGTVQFTAKVETGVTGEVIFKAGSRVVYWQTSAP